MNNEKEKDHEHEHGEHALNLTINDNSYKWHQQYITGAEIRKLGHIPEDHEIFLGIIRPWEDEHIKDDTRVDLAREGIEHFYSKRHGEHKMVTIYVNDDPREISRGNHTVAEIKTVGRVSLAWALEEDVKGKLTPLYDNATILIKGGEKFYAHARGGQSS